MHVQSSSSMQRARSSHPPKATAHSGARTWNTPDERRSTAGGEKTAWVAQAYTSRAPSACSTCPAQVASVV